MPLKFLGGVVGLLSQAPTPVEVELGCDNYQYKQPITSDDDEDKPKDQTKATVNLIPTRSIQKFTFLSRGKQATLFIDSGAEADCITIAEADRLHLDILPLEPNDKIPNQADGVSPLDTIGSVKTSFTRGDLKLHWHGYVVKTLSQWPPLSCKE